jgi:hypothetical protein
MKESQHQSALLKYFGYRYPDYFDYLIHIPNGGSRNKIEAYNFKKQGVRAGFPDLQLLVPRGTYHGLFIELKTFKGKLNIKQKHYLQLLNAQGYLAQCCYGWHEAADLIDTYMRLPLWGSSQVYLEAV